MPISSVSPVNKRSKFAVTTRRGDDVDDYHGAAVPDPYRWLEDGDASVPSREEIRARLTVRPGDYPPTLLTTGDHDDCVVPAHSFKSAAALQAAQAGHAPILLRTDARAGHGAGKPAAKAITESADRLAFLDGALGMAPWSGIAAWRGKSVGHAQA
jgi:protease II